MARTNALPNIIEQNLVQVKEYFKLQFKMANRRLKDNGLEPVLAYLILIAGFIALSIYLFHKTEYAAYLYLLISLSFTAKLSETRRNEFLKTSFKNSQFRKIRIVENAITAAPFLFFLMYKQLFILALLLIILTVLLALIHFGTTFYITIPTPFYRKPFEFTVGFRNTFYLFPVAYILACIAVSVSNFNLGIFSMLFVFTITLSFYAKPENEYFVWSYNLTAKQFLLEKIKTALLYSSLLTIPVVLILGIYYHEKIDTILFSLFAGYAFLTCVIVVKYTSYPNEISLLQGILLGISLFYPSILVIFIPYFFNQSVKRLKVFLK